MKYSIASDFLELEKKSIPFIPHIYPTLNKLMVKSNAKFNFPSSLKIENKKIESYDNAPFELTILTPLNDASTENCLIYFHGGAFAIQAAPYHLNLAVHYAVETPCKVVFVNYRLAPKYPFPIGFEDGYSTCKWVWEHAEELGINRTKIALGGDSAGASIAAACALRARDSHTMTFCHQMLVYPVLDSRMQTASMKRFIDTPMWDAKKNLKMWQMYLKKGSMVRSEYASPSLASHLESLPPAYIEVCEFDCLHDEGVAYAERLQETGVEVELNDTRGTVHGYDMVEHSPITLQHRERRIQALQKAFKFHNT